MGEGKHELSDEAIARTGAVHRERHGVRDDASVAQLLEKRTHGGLALRCKQLAGARQEVDAKQWINCHGPLSD